MIDATHDSQLTSWVDSANDPATDFPPQNLPLGVFKGASSETARSGVAIGEMILDIASARGLGLFDGDAQRGAAVCGETLNGFMALGPREWSAFRGRVSDLLRADTALGKRAAARADVLLVPQKNVTMQLPARIGDYSDFYASIDHATNVGSMLRPDNPLLPNYKWVPIGYHGRASSIVVSGTPLRRPSGQRQADAASTPTFGPSLRLDYELEMGMFIGPGNALGASIPIAQASEHLFGLCLLNDWSARDIQAWEYQPLGPFLSKNFATSISPWVITAAALAPFHAPVRSRAAEDPQALVYLDDADDRRGGALDVALEVYLQSRLMRERGQAPQRLSLSRFAGMYWSPAQLIAHHSSNGCNLQPGDIIGSGTVSGDTQHSRGCLLELTWRGTQPLTLPSGEARRFLEDGDIVIFRAFADRPGFRRIGFGECSGEVLATNA
ncbi:MAG: fumarylacetoacetase [Gemmatimonadaceae bacterium]